MSIHFVSVFWLLQLLIILFACSSDTRSVSYDKTHGTQPHHGPHGNVHRHYRTEIPHGELKANEEKKLFAAQLQPEVESGINLPLSVEDRNLIERMASDSLGSAIENNERRTIAVIYIQNAGSTEILDLFENFVVSALKNAPEFASRKLLVAALDDACFDLTKSLGISNILRVHNGSTSMSSSFKFRLIHTLLSFNTSVLMMEADQVILKNPFLGLVGDSDIELATDYVRPTLAFSDIYALDQPLGQAIHEVADSSNIGLVFISPNILTSLVIRTMIETEATVLTRTKAFVWDQKRFNLLLYSFMESPVVLCYLGGTIAYGKWIPGARCSRRHDLHLLIRLLPIETFPLGPSYMWGKLHCRISGRDARYLEQFIPEDVTPVCETPNEASNVHVVHAAGLLDVSKIYFFRDRFLWFVNESTRFENRIIVSITNPQGGVTEQISILVQQIAWSLAINGELVLPLLDCSFIPHGIEVWRIGNGGKCPLDMFLKLSSLGTLLQEINDQNGNRSWNKIQARQRMYTDIPFLENSALFVGGNKLYIKNIEDNRAKVSHTGWMKEIWGDRLIEVNIVATSAALFTLKATWHDGSQKSYSFQSDDVASMQKLIDTLRQAKEHHVHISGLSFQSMSAVMHSLPSFISSSFESPQDTCAKIRDALFW